MQAFLLTGNKTLSYFLLSTHWYFGFIPIL